MENCQQNSLKKGMATATIDHEIEKPRTMINKAYANDMISDETVKTFKKVKKLTKKGSDIRDRILSNELYKILRALPSCIQKTDSDQHVFQYKGSGMKKADRNLKTACKDAGIKYGRFTKGSFVFHDLRHTFNTNMRKALVSESVIMEITGHSTREMFNRYNNIDDDDKRNAVNQLEQFFSNVTQMLSQTEQISKSE